MIPKVVLTVLLSQYVRSRVDDLSASAACLYWTGGSVVEYRQSASGNPETGPSAFAAVTTAFATWQSQLEACGSLTLREGEHTASRFAGYVERGSNENVVLFRRQDCHTSVASSNACWAAGTCGNTLDCWEHSKLAIAITTTSYHPVAGFIYDSDIELNTPSYVFSTVASPPCVGGRYSTSCVATDVQNTVTHEVGHVLGLGHVNVAGSTMSPRADPGELSKRVLDDGSKQFICDVYPKGQAARACAVAPVSDTLGNRVRGCTSAPAGLFTWVAALLLVARRRR